MGFSDKWHILAWTVVGVTITEIASYFMQRFLCSIKFQKQNKRSKEIREIIFFPDDQPACITHITDRYGCLDTQCKFSHSQNSLSSLIKHMASAKRNLDICIFTFTSAELANVVLRLWEQGVEVRIITDAQQLDVTGSQIGKLRASGIQVRNNRESYFMHHKFALVDGNMLINGSFNWTRQAITGNNENILITSENEFVEPFKEQFEHLWNLFDPKLKTS